MKDEKFPFCDHYDCAGYEGGRCIVLIVNDYPEDGCPFFKTREQAAKERAYCEERKAMLLSTKK